MATKTQHVPTTRKAKDERVRNLAPKERKLLKEFGRIMRAEREAQELTLYDIESRGYPSWQHWQKLEDGLRDFRLTTVMKISKVLKKHPGELFGALKLKN